MLKVARFYWGSEYLSYFRYLTFKTFSIKNPEYDLVLYIPENPSQEYLQKLSHRYENYFHLLKDLPRLEIRRIDLRKIGLKDNYHEAYKSNYVKWWILKNYGGWFFDTDIVWFKPVPKYPEIDYIFLAKDYNYYPSYMYSKKDIYIIDRVLSNFISHGEYKKKNFGDLGHEIMSRIYNTPQEYIEKNPWLKVKIEDPRIIFPIAKIRDIKKIYDNRELPLCKCIGIHWFGGHPLSAEMENKLTPETYLEGNIYDIIRSVILYTEHTV